MIKKINTSQSYFWEVVAEVVSFEITTFNLYLEKLAILDYDVSLYKVNEVDIASAVHKAS